MEIKKEALEQVIREGVEGLHNMPFFDRTASAIMNIGEIQVQVVITRDEDEKIDELDKGYTDHDG